MIFRRYQINICILTFLVSICLKTTPTYGVEIHVSVTVLIGCRFGFSLTNKESALKICDEQDFQLHINVQQTRALPATILI